MIEGTSNPKRERKDFIFLEESSEFKFHDSDDEETREYTLFPERHEWRLKKEKNLPKYFSDNLVGFNFSKFGKNCAT